MQEIKSVKDAEVSGKRVLVRVNFDVPMRDGKIVDDTRIKSSAPTLELLHGHGAKEIILLTHVGRPEGRVVEALRVAPMAARLHELTKIPFVVEENLRFDAGEESNDPAFAKKLASLGDIFVNDAFSMSHRAQASVVGITKFLPSYAGLRFSEEVARLSEALTPPAGSLAIIGGAKFETKEPLIKKLLTKYAEVLVGGALGNDLIKARGWPVGASLVSSTPVPVDLASDERLTIATDAVVKETTTNAEREALVVDTQATEAIVDIGPATAEAWAQKVARAPFVLWNGPLGIYEEGFTRGTDAVASALVQSGVKAVVGGGDTAAAVTQFTFDPKKVFVSTGGGAMLEFLVAGTLPGIEALKA